MTQIRKKFMTLLLFAISVTGAFAQAVGSDFKVGEITYTVTKNDLQHHSDNFVSCTYWRKGRRYGSINGYTSGKS